MLPRHRPGRLSAGVRDTLRGGARSPATCELRRPEPGCSQPLCPELMEAGQRRTGHSRLLPHTARSSCPKLREEANKTQRVLEGTPRLRCPKPVTLCVTLGDTALSIAQICWPLGAAECCWRGGHCTGGASSFHPPTRRPAGGETEPQRCCSTCRGSRCAPAWPGRLPRRALGSRRMGREVQGVVAGFCGCSVGTLSP